MTIDEILDEHNVEGLEVETAILESIYRDVKALRKCYEKHYNMMIKAKNKAAEEQQNGNSEKSNRWMEIYWQEERAKNYIRDELRKYGQDKINKDECN